MRLPVDILLPAARAPGDRWSDLTNRIAASRLFCSLVDAETRLLARRRLSDERRRLAGLPAIVDAAELFQANQGGKALGPLAWEACGGDGLLALACALDVLEMKREQTEAA